MGRNTYGNRHCELHPRVELWLLCFSEIHFHFQVHCHVNISNSVSCKSCLYTTNQSRAGHFSSFEDPHMGYSCLHVSFRLKFSFSLSCLPASLTDFSASHVPFLSLPCFTHSLISEDNSHTHSPSRCEKFLLNPILPSF